MTTTIAAESDSTEAPRRRRRRPTAATPPPRSPGRRPRGDDGRHRRHRGDGGDRRLRGNRGHDRRHRRVGRLSRDRRVAGRGGRDRRRPLHVRRAVRRWTRRWRPRASRCVIGFQNPEGDPNGSFPEASLAPRPRVDYINAELGGWGADIQNGIPGRPIELEVCRTAISPDDSQRCANELVGEGPGHHRLDDQLLRQPPADLRGRRDPGHRDVAGDDRRLHVAVGVRHRRRWRLPRPAHRAGRVRHQRPRGDARRRAVGRHAPGRRLLLRPRGQAARRHQGRRPERLRAGRRDPRSRAHRRADQAGDAGRDAAGHPGARLRPRRDHLLGPGRRLLEPRRRARPPRLDARGHPAGALRRRASTSTPCGPPATSPTASTSSTPAARGDQRPRHHRGSRGQRFEAEIFQTKPLEYGMPESELYKGFGVQQLQQHDRHLGAGRVGSPNRARSRRRRRSQPTSPPPRTTTCSARRRCRAHGAAALRGRVQHHLDDRPVDGESLDPVRDNVLRGRPRSPGPNSSPDRDPETEAVGPVDGPPPRRARHRSAN